MLEVLILTDVDAFVLDSIKKHAYLTKIIPRLALKDQCQTESVVYFCVPGIALATFINSVITVLVAADQPAYCIIIISYAGLAWLADAQ